MSENNVAVTDEGTGSYHDSAKAHGLWRVEKFEGNDAYVPGATPYEVVEFENLFMFGGISFLWQCAQGLGGSGALAYLTNAACAIGVGDSTTAAAGTQTDLQAVTNKLRKGMNATYPSQTDGTTNAARFIAFQSTFSTSEANFAWQEFAVFNALSGGRMLNRAVQSLGTKTSASSWQTLVTLDIS